MCSLVSYLAYAEAHNMVLKCMDGLIMYPVMEETPIPHYIYFMPMDITDVGSLSKFLNSHFLYLPGTFYVLYFHPIRWILPDLGETIRSMPCLPVGYGQSRILFHMSCGRMTFDVTPDKTIREEEKETVFRVPLYLKETSFFINVVELPDHMGTPKIFEQIDFEL
ncbi:hypothetical protein [Pedobacter sp. L105]|uniref:hypothetical protein n=1 Tax=Pedobacter sp. L105 TaxID=1641871 RepID=UPI00131B10D6|nr:hypothetical protein [Pedobacter sp. L105]